MAVAMAPQISSDTYDEAETSSHPEYPQTVDMELPPKELAFAHYCYWMQSVDVNLYHLGCAESRKSSVLDEIDGNNEILEELKDKMESNVLTGSEIIQYTNANHKRIELDNLLKQVIGHCQRWKNLLNRAKAELNDAKTEWERERLIISV